MINMVYQLAENIWGHKLPYGYLVKNNRGINMVLMFYGLDHGLVDQVVIDWEECVVHFRLLPYLSDRYLQKTLFLQSVSVLD